jgi:hypothetical protein
MLHKLFGSNKSIKIVELGAMSIPEYQLFYRTLKSKAESGQMSYNVYLVRHQQVQQLVKKASMTNNKAIFSINSSKSDLVIIL